MPSTNIGARTGLVLLTLSLGRLAPSPGATTGHDKQFNPSHA